MKNWIIDNKSSLISAGIAVEGRFPLDATSHQDKGMIGLTRGYIIVSFTVWDRELFMIETVIFNAKSGDTLLFLDQEVSTTSEAILLLENIKNGLISGQYYI